MVIITRMSTTLQLQGTRQRSNSYDFISQMSDDILVMILSLLTLKGAVVTSSLSRRWRFVWCNLTKLDFDGGETLHKIADDQNSERSKYHSKYINHVNSVIKGHRHPTIQDFRIRFCLTKRHKGVIDEWLQFAINKKVEFLELNLMNDPPKVNQLNGNSDYPLKLFDTKLSSPSVNATVVEILSLKKLVLKKVKVTETILQEFLTNCPHLETLFIHYTSRMKNIHVYGHALKLKHFTIVSEWRVDSICLSDFDLVSFTCKGPVADLRLSHLPKLKEVDIDNKVRAMLRTNVFDQISSCALTLQVLSINIDVPKKSEVLHSIPELPSVKKLRLKIGGSSKFNILKYLASILNACPNLVTLTIQQLWTSPILTSAKDVTNPHEHLKIVEIEEHSGLVCDMKLVKYIIHTAVALKKIVIDPCGDPGWVSDVRANNFLGIKQAARRQLASVLPRGVDLCIL